ncbi:hypothetical protein IWT140_02236 [Secundilactobacillus pentosiphilus]|uniref:DUF5067 domain-containing protein n=1 Tax=Secundilactobacillus pentosiphilus TaxID=1714682 RepID=A0A1Z5IS44_9LACO|nr:DUF5067 domain-containing protein [Secundilactobacillus pentosiphilus]GAX04594.1 hypothetical protein IWT140_02236 [Secundilactobacillus pentosiphilus]
MKKIALTSVAILSIVAGTLDPANTVFAKKHSLKHQSISSVVLRNGKLSGKAKSGSKISAYHGSKKLGSATIKNSHFTFKLKGVKNNWKVKLVAAKKGYKKATKTVVAHVSTSKSGNYTPVSVQPKPKKEYLSGDTLVLKQGKFNFGSSTREPDGDGGTNILVFFTYTNTTSKMIELDDLVSDNFTARQSIGKVTKDLDPSVTSDDSQYSDQAEIMDNSEYVNPGQTVSTVAAWDLDSDSAPVKISFYSPNEDTNLGTLTYY